MAQFRCLLCSNPAYSSMVEEGNKLDAKETAKHYRNSSFKQGPGFTSKDAEKIREGKLNPNLPRR